MSQLCLENVSMLAADSKCHSQLIKDGEAGAVATIRVLLSTAAGERTLAGIKSTADSHSV